MSYTISETIVICVVAILIVIYEVNIGHAAPPNTTTAPPRKYWRRNKLDNRNIPCTDAEKKCFKNGLVWYPPTGSCYSLFERGPCHEDQWIVVDKEEALDHGGHVIGKCEYNVTRLCPPRRVLMASDGSCVLGVLACGGASVHLDVFGEGECKAPDDEGPTPLPVVLSSNACATPAPEGATYLHILNPRTKQNCIQNNRGDCIREAKISYEVFIDW